MMGRTLKFNPGFQSDEEAVENFIVRQEEFQTIIRTLRPGAEGPPRVLVVAPRGAGKTTVCRRVLAEVRRDASLNAAWQPIFLGEENYIVTTPGEFFLECLFQLRDQAPSPELDAAFEAARSAKSDEDLLERTTVALASFAKEIGKRLLIIVENFHMILSDQLAGSKKGADRLLAALRDERLFGVLATSVAQAAPGERHLPNDFISLTLRPLSVAECQDLWIAITGQKVKPERIRPLHILTGGSPRLLHILADFMKTPSLQDLMADLNLLIDQNTEYFKSQLDGLPARERKVFAALLDAWDPSTAKQIAEGARVSVNNASAMLARLSDRGAVIKEPGAGRSWIYYAAERLFNIYYLMRRRSHPSARVKALVTFMIEYYDQDELVSTMELVVREACTLAPALRGDYHSAFDQILLRSPAQVRARILQKTSDEFLESLEADRRERQAATVSRFTEKKSAISWQATIFDKVEEALSARRFDEAVSILEQGIAHDPSSVDLLLRLTFVHFDRDDKVSALQSARRAQRLDHTDSSTNVVLGLAFERAGDLEAAEKAYRAALSAEVSEPVALVELADLLERKGEVEEALSFFSAAEQVGGLVDETRSEYGRLLREREQYALAERILREGVDNVENIETRRQLVDLLDELERPDEAVHILRSAAQDSGRWQLWADLGTYLLRVRSEFGGAVEALETSVELGADDPAVFGFLGEAKFRGEAEPSELAEIAAKLLERLPGHPRARTNAGLLLWRAGNDSKAEEILRASAKDPEQTHPAALLLAKLLQSKPERREDAEKVLRDAIESPGGQGHCSLARELAELLIHRGEDGPAREVLSKEIETTPSCACCRDLLGDLYIRHGDLAAAQREFETVLDSRPEDSRALVGLSRIVGGAEADRLIERAIVANPKDTDALLARARRRVDDVEGQVNDALQVLELRPRSINGHVFLAPLLAGQGDIDRAVYHLGEALTALPSERELIANFVASAMAVARYGGVERLSQLLADHEGASLVEPLVVALRIERGEQPLVAKEVLEVARDIVAGIKA